MANTDYSLGTQRGAPSPPGDADAKSVLTDYDPNEPPTPKTDFTEAQAETILAYVRKATEAAVKGDPFDAVLDADIDRAPAFGVFVTLRRATQLRACRGRWGGAHGNSLGQLLAMVTRDTATLDTRFPAITAHELDFLGVDVSLMHDPAMVEAQGEDRIDAIEVGTHGLVIDHPQGRGLLLPHVATESGWDAKTFLDHLATKAGLPSDTWRRDPGAKLMTFKTRLMTSESPRVEMDVQGLRFKGLNQLLTLTNLVLTDQPFEDCLTEALTTAYEQEMGVHLETESGATTVAAASSRSLLDLVMAAVRSLKNLDSSDEPAGDPVKHVTLLWQPIRLRAQDYPARHQYLGNSVVRARRAGQWQLALPGPQGRTDQVAGALRAIRMHPSRWHELEQRGEAEVTAFTALRFDAREAPQNHAVRKPAQAGRFYPAQAEAMQQEVDKYLAMGDAAANAAGVEKEPFRAVMLPHAGWRFCGETLGKTLARVRVPQTVIVIGPKHTPHGAVMSVAPHQQWQIPGAAVPIATDLAQRLVELAPGIQAEPDAHQHEHGCEVLLPFLQRVQPGLRVLPVVMGQTTYEDTQAVAQALATLIEEAQSRGEEPPLLVISSDMNHFAPEMEGSRLDRMAIDAMLSGDPVRLYETCQRHQISMCGVLPAVAVMQTLAADSQAMKIKLIHYSNSAKASGDASRVVGYAGVTIG